MGNDDVMMWGTFANVRIRIRNKMADGKEGGVFTKFMPERQLMSVFDACQIYEQGKILLIIFAGRDYGMGSPRDWAFKEPALLFEVFRLPSKFYRKIKIENAPFNLHATVRNYKHGKGMLMKDIKNIDQMLNY